MQYSLRVHGLAHATCEQEPILTWAPLRARPGSARNDFVRVALAQCVVAPSPPLREFCGTVLWTLAGGSLGFIQDATWLALLALRGFRLPLAHWLQQTLLK